MTLVGYWPPIFQELNVVLNESRLDLYVGKPTFVRKVAACTLVAYRRLLEALVHDSAGESLL